MAVSCGKVDQVQTPARVSVEWFKKSEQVEKKKEGGERERGLNRLPPPTWEECNVWYMGWGHGWGMFEFQVWGLTILPRKSRQRGGVG